MERKPRAWIVIPARLNSTRLPGKMLLRETGQYLVVHTWEAATKSRRAEKVVIATDSKEIQLVAQEAGAEVVLTSTAPRCGTERVAEAVRLLTTGPDCIPPNVIINLQGDEPEINPQSLDDLIDTISANSDVGMATLATPIRDRSILFDPACVKVLFDSHGRAVYFSRTPIPYPKNWDESLLWHEPPVYWQHIGVYGFRREVLERFVALPPASWEEVESLEQLRAVWHGISMAVVTVPQHVGGIDTPEDYARFVARWRAKTGSLAEAHCWS
jgi:3-deoxy-manno-octulosonate cytidylyltransferase (CMP-KDO synthetase)